MEKMFNGQSAGKNFRENEMRMWLACAIESEGSIQLAWGKRKDGYIQIVPRVNLGNKDNDYIERVSLFSKSLGLDGYVSSYVSKGGMKYITWYGFKRVKKLLEAIKDLLHTRKRTITEAVLEFINYRLSLTPRHQYGQKEKDLFLRVRELNGKGMISNEMLRCRFENGLGIKEKRNCLQCDTEFIVENKYHKYCSVVCKKRYALKLSSETNTPNIGNSNNDVNFHYLANKDRVRTDMKVSELNRNVSTLVKN